MNILSVEELNKLCTGSLIEHLGILFTESGEKIIKATMPVDLRTIQPMGLVHGGAVMALVETVGSVGSYNIVDREKYNVVGMEINGNHIGNTKSKSVYAIGRLLHKGQRTHVWGVDVFDEDHKAISICRITNMVIEKDV